MFCFPTGFMLAVWASDGVADGHGLAQVMAVLLACDLERI